MLYKQKKQEWCIARNLMKHFPSDSTKPVLPAPVPQAQVSGVEGFHPGYVTCLPFSLQPEASSLLLRFSLFIPQAPSTQITSLS